MSQENREQLVERIVPLLSEREAHAYRVWQGTEQGPVPPALNAKFFALYLQGKSTEEIRKLNSVWSLGQIVAARIEGRWDDLRTEHLERLLRETSLRVHQVTLETADLVSDLLAAAKRQHGEKLQRYIQTGDPTELGEFKIDSINGLKQAVEVLQKLTGQERQQVVSHQGQVSHVVEPTLVTQPSATEAADALKLLLGHQGDLKQ